MGGRWDGWEGMGSRIEGGKEREEEKGRERAGGDVLVLIYTQRECTCT